MPKMGGVAPGVDRRKVGCFKIDLSAGFAHPMDLFHELDDITNMFDDVKASYFLEVVAGQVPGRLVNIKNLINPFVLINIDAVGPFGFVASAAKIEKSFHLAS
jgi:hypothetical protein